LINLDDEFEYNNEEEAEVAQIVSLQLHLKGLNAIQDKLNEQRMNESLYECCECGEEIPEARRQAIKGVTTCVNCQELNERRI